MKADRAWQYALEQLQTEMPKATFDHWVRNTCVVAYEDGEFIIATSNEYTREWLEGRLTSTVTRLLTGLINRSVQVRFIVDPSIRKDEGSSPLESAKIPHLGEEDKQLKIQLAHACLRDEFVHPNRVTVIPGYFRRWLPYLGPTLAWIVVAFRQAMFMATHHEARAEVDFEISPAAVARWAGIDRTTLWRRLDDNLLGWFLIRSDRDWNTFRFTTAMPLTPGDLLALFEWLISIGIRDDPIVALEKSLTVDTQSILPTPPPRPSQEQLDMIPEPQSVQDVILGACGRINNKTMLNKVMELADRLAERLMPSGDTIHVTHYFLFHHLPFIGAAPAWLVTLLRDRCYVDKEHPRDTVWIRDGYAEIAQMLGLRRPKTVSEWLLPVFKTKANRRSPHLDHPEDISDYKFRGDLHNERRSAIHQFIQRTDISNGSSLHSWHFKVTLIEPLSPEDQAAYDWMIDLVGNYLETGDRREIDSLLSAESGTLEARMRPGRVANTTRRGANATRVDEDEARLQWVVARVQHRRDANATRTGENATWDRRECNTMRRECNALNPLNMLLKLLEQLGLNSTNPSEATQEVASDSPIIKPERSIVVVEPNWDLSVLFSRNPSVKIDTQKILLEQNASAHAFVSWLIYAASPAGKGITKPAQFAASKLVGNNQAGAGCIYDRMAALPPKNLYELIDGVLSGFRPCSTIPASAHTDWQSVMTSGSSERIVALKGQLFG